MSNGFFVTANPPAAGQEPTVTNDGWFPDMDPAKVRNACRLDGTVTADRLLPALQNAMLTVNAELQDWADEQRCRWGYASLGEVPAAQVGGESAKLLHYRRAVHAALQADLVQTYRGMPAMATGNKLDRESDDLQQTAGDYLRQLRNAISDIRGSARCTVELL
ncbi:head completion/stabilization protein [Comamonas jiangduensis]|uniref:Head completion/stabilization protein n=1 Tax=Comamonas jiangduensis TaxID=1194168 RepID=A0ABV4IB60_9BURK